MVVDPNDTVPTDLPEEHGDAPIVSQPFWPALQVGAVTGTSGLFVGGIAGLVRSRTPVLFAVASGIQWFALGTAYWASRSIFLNLQNKGALNRNDRLRASGAAGALTGGAAGLWLRGRRNVIPGAVMFSLFGLVGQEVYQLADDRHTARRNLDAQGVAIDSVWRQMTKWKWSPIKALSDADYEEILKEKVLKLDVEIALIDERIDQLGKGAENRLERDRVQPRQSTTRERE